MEFTVDLTEEGRRHLERMLGPFDEHSRLVCEGVCPECGGQLQQVADARVAYAFCRLHWVTPPTP